MKYLKKFNENSDFLSSSEKKASDIGIRNFEIEGISYDEIEYIKLMGYINGDYAEFKIRANGCQADDIDIERIR